MRLWSVHPMYLDSAGLNACWREGLLAKHVLEGKTKGYTNHPQLQRFKQSADPISYINAFLTEIYLEASKRGYSYNPDKIKLTHNLPLLSVTEGQIRYEMMHLERKLEKRNPEYLKKIIPLVDIIQPHPIFSIHVGEIEEWEVII